MIIRIKSDARNHFRHTPIVANLNNTIKNIQMKFEKVYQNQIIFFCVL